jgi:hypothetical protein
MSRKVKKEESSKGTYDDSDAFDVDLEGRVLIYPCGDSLVFQSIKVPETIQKYIRPRY